MNTYDFNDIPYLNYLCYTCELSMVNDNKFYTCIRNLRNVCKHVHPGVSNWLRFHWEYFIVNISLEVAQVWAYKANRTLVGTFTNRECVNNPLQTSNSCTMDVHTLNNLHNSAWDFLGSSNVTLCSKQSKRALALSMLA